MGSGCFKAKSQTTTADEPQPFLASSESGHTRSAASSDLALKLAPVTQAAGKPSRLNAAKLDEVLKAFGRAEPAAINTWFQLDWLPSASGNLRNGLQTVLKRAAEHTLDASTAEAEKALTKSGEMAANFEHACNVVERHVKIDGELHQSLAAICMVAGTVGRLVHSEKEENASMCIIPAFDKFVLVFRRALLADPAAGGFAAGRLQRWKELRAETGVPALEEQLVLLSCTAKSSLLGLLLLPENAKNQVVVDRDACVLLGAAEQLPSRGACVLSPYFESATGTKTVQGRRVEGGEGHGPRKEFFIAVSTDTTRQPGNGQPPPILSFHRGAGQHWFSAYAADLEAGPRSQDQRLRLRCFGKVLALAVANHCKLSFTLPQLFFRLLLRPPQDGEAPATLEQILSLDSSLHASLKKCLKMNNAKFKALKAVEGHPEELTREEYVQEQVTSLMAPDAMREVRTGFWGIAGDFYNWRDVLPSDLRQITCPTYSASEELNIRRIFEVVIEEDMAEDPAFVAAFWAVVDTLTKEEKRLFLVFVTGVEAPPEPGSEQLLIQLPFSAFTVEEHAAMLERLPQAHTCSNLLELPNYPESLRETGKVTEAQGRAVMEKELKTLLGSKLRQAINETGGYELDAIEDPADCSSPSGVFQPPGVIDDFMPHAPTANQLRPFNPEISPRPVGGFAGASIPLTTTTSLASIEAINTPSAKPSEQDFAAFLQSLEKEPMASSKSFEEQKRDARVGNIDNLLEELDQAMAIE